MTQLCKIPINKKNYNHFHASTNVPVDNNIDITTKITLTFHYPKKNFINQKLFIIMHYKE